MGDNFPGLRNKTGTQFIESGKVVIIGEDFRYGENVKVKDLTCNGRIKQLRFYARVSAPFKLLVFKRDVEGDLTKWKLVGMIKVPATQVVPNEYSVFDVPYDEQLPIKTDRHVIGMEISASKNPEMIYFDLATDGIAGVKNKHEFLTNETLVIGKTYTTEEPSDYVFKRFVVEISNYTEAQGQ